MELIFFIFFDKFRAFKFVSVLNKNQKIKKGRGVYLYVKKIIFPSWGV